MHHYHTVAILLSIIFTLSFKGFAQFTEGEHCKILNGAFRGKKAVISKVVPITQEAICNDAVFNALLIRFAQLTDAEKMSAASVINCSLKTNKREILSQLPKKIITDPLYLVTIERNESKIFDHHQLEKIG